MRVATYDPGLSREGPGLLLRDIERDDPQVLAAAKVIASAAPDVILLTGLDWDLDGRALSAFAAKLTAAGYDMPHRFAARPNSGLATGLDMNGDGRTGRADDAQGFGQFAGQNGMAVLSRLPIGQTIDYSTELWKNIPDNIMPATKPEIAAIQRLSSSGHWDVQITTPDGPLHLLAWSATPPVFDGKEDRNGRRNHDEAAFWLDHLPDAAFVLLGKINLDPVDGEGRPEALAALLNHAQDTAPKGAYQPTSTGANATHQGDPELDTAAFDVTGPGNLRVDYVLPDNGLTVLASGVLWPSPDTDLGKAVALASDHRLIWVDLNLADSKLD
ncbi:endonuclease/exonuclease/phosphatase family protein [Paracoccus sp. 11-3]|uniref:Endonuclease/exonuclease/phosphatase family protein n=1 Tax=Paracoccus amoyensis TaxID=2760093 RepID=A0A926JCC8_9RHOB|nr:endonuclease/exonuclease/phosphatase family protein [Paracoccus amoyensis]